MFYRGLGEYYRKNEAQAIDHFEHAFLLDGSVPQARIGKAMSFALQHRPAKGIAILKALEERTSSHSAYDPEAVYKIAQGYAVCGDRAAALRVLKRSIDTGFFPYDYIATDPLLASLHKDELFASLIEAARRRHNAFQKMFF